MKKFSKICLVSLCIVLLTGFCSCSLFSAKEKEFTAAGMTITLTDEFTEKSLVSQTAYYESVNAIVMALKEDLSAFTQLGLDNISLKEYAELVIKQNSMNATVEEKDGLTMFTYKKSVSDKDFTYLATVFKSSDAFWLIQFGCETKNYDKYSSDFQKWAGTVKFS